ncbi:MAG: radical SAM protein [Bacteroidaceae bacterium]|nr:radical SAM protein [Bacteroidaceae bacterium]
MALKDWTSLTKIACRVVGQTPIPLLWTFAWNFGWRNLWYMRSFEKRSAKGKKFFPAFVMISVTESCNLRCSGCWVSAGGKKRLTNEQLDGIISSCKAEGSYFFGILGGEPLMYKGLFDVFKKHSDCYFQLFTNATLLTDDIAKQLRALGNVTPLISVEGLKDESDRRRGANEVYDRTLNGIRACRKEGLIFGVAASICKNNFDELVSRDHIERVAKEGAAYLWYYIYRPVGANPMPEAALDKTQIKALREFLVEERRDAPVVLIDTYWDDKGVAMCPGATGMSHHVGPSGALEFCPPLQMACEYVDETGKNVGELFKQSSFMADLRVMTAEQSRGCILMENPKYLAAFLAEHGATDTTSRQTVMKEYMQMASVAGHDMGEDAIPERSAPYRWLKKNYFFGFGAYG